MGKAGIALQHGGLSTWMRHLNRPNMGAFFDAPGYATSALRFALHVTVMVVKIALLFGAKAIEWKWFVVKITRP